MAIRILLSKMSVFGLPMNMAMKLAKNCGFDGMEILINEWFKDRIPHYRSLAQKLGLDLHYHQAWSADEDPSDKSFVILEKIGYLPRSGYSLRNHIPDSVGNDPTIVSAERINQVAGREPNFWYQTDCIFEDSAPKLTFSEFVRMIKKFNLPVVFDVLHYLEYRLGVFRNYNALPTEKSELMKLLEEGWGIFGPHTREIHLCDFRPGERNTFLGDGIMPLEEFCKLVKNSGWQGAVVPEVSPMSLFPYRKSSVKELKTIVETLFE